MSELFRCFGRFCPHYCYAERPLPLNHVKDLQRYSGLW